MPKLFSSKDCVRMSCMRDEPFWLLPSTWKMVLETVNLILVCSYICWVSKTCHPRDSCWIEMSVN